MLLGILKYIVIFVEIHLMVSMIIPIVISFINNNRDIKYTRYVIQMCEEFMLVFSLRVNHT